MRVLYLLRHARASLGGAAVTDFDRPLSERGREESPLVGRFMRGKGARPGSVVSSPALRARETAELVSEAAGLGSGIEFDERVYEADSGRLLSVVAATPDEVAELLLVGHNPGLAELLARLSGERQSLPPASLARVELKIGEWREVADGCGRLEWLATPGESEAL